MDDKIHELVGYMRQYSLELGRTPTKAEFIHRYGNERAICVIKFTKLIDMAGLEHSKFSNQKRTENKPKILLLDIETAPIQAYVWSLFDNVIGLNQMIQDWHLLSWSAKWHGGKEVFYEDQRNEEVITNDKRICKSLWELINRADIVVGHNVERFDLRKINSRFIENGLKPPSNYRTIDTLKVAKKRFGFTSNKLEHIAKKICKNKKLTKRKFSGFSLWEECIKRNSKAWEEMEKYNKQDVFVLEEVYDKVISWDNKINFSSFYNGVNVCRCGADEFTQDGHIVTNSGKFLRYVCQNCGANYQDKKNMIKPKDMLKPV